MSQCCNIWRVNLNPTVTTPFDEIPILKELSLFVFDRALAINMARAEEWCISNLGCSLREGWVILCASSGEFCQQTIGKMLGIHPNTMVKIADRLEKSGFLKREKNPKNRREYILRVTGKGQEAMKTYRKRKIEAYNYAFHPIPYNAVKSDLARALSTIVADDNQKQEKGTKVRRP